MTVLSTACAVLLIVGSATGWPAAIAVILAAIAFAGFALLATVAIGWLWHYVRPPRNGPWR